MTYDEKRIAIATAMGWEKLGWMRDKMVGYAPGTYHLGVIKNAPDPLNSHSDAMAVVDWLQDHSFSVTITHWSQFGKLPKKCGVRFDHDNGRQQSWSGDDYREGIVELAAPIAKEVLSAKR